MITIVDYGMGNFGSMMNMFKYLDIDATISSKINTIEKAKKIVLVGVGAFDAAMERIESTPGLKDILNQKALIEKVPVLGVCLGMQLLTEKSQEGHHKGLGWISGETVRFPNNNNFKIPHMGWNLVKVKNNHPIIANVDNSSRFYFVHSFYVKTSSPQHVLLESEHGIEFSAAIARENICGVQFHPEKSHRFGMNILKNFSEI